MQQYLYKIQPVRPRMLSEGPTEQESQVVSDHYSYLKELMEQGTVILAGRTQNTDYSSFGIVIFKAGSLEQARRIVENDPAVKGKVMRAELYPYRIALFNASNASSSNQRAIGHRESLAEVEGALGAEEKASLTVEIRALEPSDYDALVDLWKTAGLPHRPGGRDSREAITSQMRRDPGLFLGAFLGGRLVGSVIASFDGRKGWINRLAVDPHERRQGIGRKLTEEAERVLKARDSQITAALVEADNSPSLLLFEKCGYTAHKDILYLTKRDSGQV